MEEGEVRKGSAMQHSFAGKRKSLMFVFPYGSDLFIYLFF